MSRAPGSQVRPPLRVGTKRILTPLLSLHHGGGAPAPGMATIPEAPKSGEDLGALVVKMENKETHGPVGIANRMCLPGNGKSQTSVTRNVSRPAHLCFLAHLHRLAEVWGGFCTLSGCTCVFFGGAGPKFPFHPIMSMEIPAKQQLPGPCPTSMVLKWGVLKIDPQT